MHVKILNYLSNVQKVIQFLYSYILLYCKLWAVKKNKEKTVSVIIDWNVNSFLRYDNNWTLN